MKKIVLIASLLFIIISCSSDNLKVDGTDQVTFNETVDKVAKELPILQQEKFKEALDIIFQYRTNPTNSDEERWAVVRSLVDDKTAEDIFELAETIASQNNFLWNRNQVPLVNGIPLPGGVELGTELEEVQDPSSNIQRFDFRVSNESDGFRLDPFFFDVEGNEIQLKEPITATVEVFNGGNIIYTKRAVIDPNSLDALYRNNGIFIKYGSLDKGKIQSNAVDVLVRIPHPDRYLTQRRIVELPASFVGSGVGVTNDSISKEVTKEVAMINTLSNRFLQNISKKNYSAAYALTRSSDWPTYQKFSQDTFVINLANSKVKDTKVLDADEKTVLVEANLVTAEENTKKYILKVENINNKWFVTDIN